MTARTTTATWAIHVQLPDTRSAAHARLRHKGKNDWRLNEFSIFLSLLLRHIILHLPYASFSLLYYVYSHFSPIPSLLLLIFQVHKLLPGWGARHVLCAIRMPSTVHYDWLLSLILYSRGIPSTWRHCYILFCLVSTSISQVALRQLHVAYPYKILRLMLCYNLIPMIMTINIPITNWWATTQLLIVLTSRTLSPGSLCQLLTIWQRPPGGNVLLVSIINSCVFAHQFNTTVRLYNISACSHIPISLLPLEGMGWATSSSECNTGATHKDDYASFIHKNLGTPGSTPKAWSNTHTHNCSRGHEAL